MASTRRKSAAIALAVVGVAGLALASAATLNVTSGSLGAGVETVASCDTDGVSVDYTTGLVDGVYQVSEVIVSGINAAAPTDACYGLTLEVTLLDDSDAAIDSATVSVDAASETLSITADAAAVEGVAVVIHS